MQNPSFIATAQRGFSGGHGGHDDHGHVQHVEKADGNHQFLAETDKKFIAFTGLKSTSPAVVEVENPYRHHNDLSLLK
jgi:hypothetical protein